MRRCFVNATEAVEKIPAILEELGLNETQVLEQLSELMRLNQVDRYHL